MYSKVKRLIREAKEKMHYHAHPDKYVVPFMPGGTLFMRNPAPPLEVKSQLLIVLTFDHYIVGIP
jgi:hypothetical protein